MGEWIKRSHRHDYPVITYEMFTKVGDQWKCDCGRIFQVCTLSRGQNSDYGSGKPYYNLEFADVTDE